MRANPIRTKVKGKEAKCSKCKVGQTQLLIRIKLITYTCDWTEEDGGQARMEREVKRKHATGELTGPTDSDVVLSELNVSRRIH